MYDFKVRECPVCFQGWILIAKEVQTRRLYLYCSECESEWESPTTLTPDSATQGKYGKVEAPSIDEINRLGWDKYLNK